MSDYKVNMGFASELSTKLSEDDFEEMAEKLYGTGLELNYECTLVFSTDIDEYLYDFGIQIGNKSTEEDFIKRVEEQGLKIEKETIKPYTCVWYNGADSDMSMTSLKDFRK